MLLWELINASESPRLQRRSGDVSGDAPSLGGLTRVEPVR